MIAPVAACGNTALEPGGVLIRSQDQPPRPAAHHGASHSIPFFCSQRRPSKYLRKQLERVPVCHLKLLTKRRCCRSRPLGHLREGDIMPKYRTHHNEIDLPDNVQPVPDHSMAINPTQQDQARSTQEKSACASDRPRLGDMRGSWLPSPDRPFPPIRSTRRRYFPA